MKSWFRNRRTGERQDPNYPSPDEIIKGGIAQYINGYVIAAPLAKSLAGVVLSRVDEFGFRPNINEGSLVELLENFRCTPGIFASPADHLPKYEYAKFISPPSDQEDRVSYMIFAVRTILNLHALESSGEYSHTKHAVNNAVSGWVHREEFKAISYPDGEKKREKSRRDYNSLVVARYVREDTALAAIFRRVRKENPIALLGVLDTSDSFVWSKRPVLIIPGANGEDMKVAYAFEEAHRDPATVKYKELLEASRKKIAASKKS